MNDVRGIAALLHLSWVLALALLLPLGLGVWLDRAFQTSPLFFMIGALSGMLAGTVAAVRIAAHAIEDVERRRNDAAEAGRKEDKAS